MSGELEADLVHLQGHVPGAEAEVEASGEAVMAAQEALGVAERAYEAAADAMEECEERGTDEEPGGDGESLEDLQQRRDELTPYSGSEWVERSEAVKDAQWDADSDWEELFNKAEEHAGFYDWDSFERCDVPDEE